MTKYYGFYALIVNTSNEMYYGNLQIKANKIADKVCAPLYALSSSAAGKPTVPQPLVKEFVKAHVAGEKKAAVLASAVGKLLEADYFAICADSKGSVDWIKRFDIATAAPMKACIRDALADENLFKPLIDRASQIAAMHDDNPLKYVAAQQNRASIDSVIRRAQILRSGAFFRLPQK